MAEKLGLPRSYTEYKDTEYNALRRRMSKLRVQQGHLPIADDMDMEAGDEYYNDLVKFWKKHKIYMGKDMMSSIAEAKAKKKAKQKGRRKSIEFEDLDMNSSGTLTLPGHITRSRLDSENDTVPEDTEWTHKSDVKKSSPRHQSSASQKQEVTRKLTPQTNNHKTTVARSLSHTDSPKYKGTNSPKSSSPKSSPKILKKAMSESAIKRSSVKTTKTVVDKTSMLTKTEK